MSNDQKSPVQEVEHYDREMIDKLKASFLEMLDDESILNYPTLKEFQDWLDVLLAHEESEDHDPSADYVEQAYQELTAEASANKTP